MVRITVGIPRHSRQDYIRVVVVVALVVVVVVKVMFAHSYS